jgi:hypothetical protein
VALLLMAGAQQAHRHALTDAGDLERLLLDYLWPALRISPAAQEAMQPFLDFQCYCRTGARLASPCISSGRCALRNKSYSEEREAQKRRNNRQQITWIAECNS